MQRFEHLGRLVLRRRELLLRGGRKDCGVCMIYKIRSLDGYRPSSAARGADFCRENTNQEEYLTNTYQKNDLPVRPQGEAEAYLQLRLAEQIVGTARLVAPSVEPLGVTERRELLLQRLQLLLQPLPPRCLCLLHLPHPLLHSPGHPNPFRSLGAR
jgi:hypothetical protein